MKKYFVFYNGEFIAVYKRLNDAVRYVGRKNLKDDEKNLLSIEDNAGNEYCPFTGEKIN